MESESPATRNIRLTLSYDGTNYVGWQVQPNGVSVQSVVETSIEKLTREKVKLIAAGRTDSGVHALGQVANFSTASRIACDQMRRGLQAFLPEDIVVRQVQEAPVDFHATYSAVRKHYRYVIHNSGVRIPFLTHYAWRYAVSLDAERMHAAARHLVGKHDFRCFESQFPNKATSVRTVESCTVTRHDRWQLWEGATEEPIAGDFLCVDIIADGFLYNMVRAITGTLVRVGRGMWEPEDVSRIIASQDRSEAGETAPAHGLYLVSVDYGSAGTVG